MATGDNAMQPSDTAGGLFNAHAAREPVRDGPSPEDVWRRLCNVDMMRPPSMNKDRTKLYEELLGEWNDLSIDDSEEWTQGLDKKLGSEKDVDDFYDWRRNRLHLARPDFDRLAPRHFSRFLGEAKWTQDDLATQIVTGRLWYGSTGDNIDYLLGWSDMVGRSGVLGLRLNAYIFDLKETALDLCGALGISTLLPHMFVGIRYRPHPSQVPPVESVTTCAVVLGELTLLPTAKVSHDNFNFSSKHHESSGYVLVYELSNSHSLSKFHVLFNPNTSTTTKADVQVAELVNETGKSISVNDLRSPDLPEAAFRLLEWRVLSSTEPEFAEVGLQAPYGAYIAMFPPEGTWI